MQLKRSRQESTQESTHLNTARTRHPHEVAKENEQNSVCAVATGFGESSSEDEVREFLRGVIKKHAMEESLEDTQCPTKPITHAFIQLDQRTGFLRLTNRQQYEPSSSNQI